MEKDKKRIKAVQTWVEDAVIGLNLCPFAKPVVVTNKLRYIIWEDIQDTRSLLLKELDLLDGDDSISTTLILLPDALNFDDYLDAYYELDEFLDQTPYRGRFQLASFHPDYVFDGSDPDDLENFSNRSPVPLIHIIDERDVSRAVDFYKDIASVRRQIKRP